MGLWSTPISFKTSVSPHEKEAVNIDGSVYFLSQNVVCLILPRRKEDLEMEPYTGYRALGVKGQIGYSQFPSEALGFAEQNAL